MKALSLALLSFTFLFQSLTFAQTEERNIDFTVSPGVLLDGEIQVAYEWLAPSEFIKKELSLVDSFRITTLHPNNNQMIASKIAFISKKSFAELSYAKMNNSAFIADMLNAVSINQSSFELWNVSNRVKAYGIPFKVSFDFKFNEVVAAKLGTKIVNYFKDEASGLKGTGKERFMTLDMTNFSQLIYRNYAVVYMKEISATETLIVSAIVTGFDLRSGNTFFNIPPFSSTQSTMMGNFEAQIMHMARSIQKH